MKREESKGCSVENDPGSRCLLFALMLSIFSSMSLWWIKSSRGRRAKFYNRCFFHWTCPLPIPTQRVGRAANDNCFFLFHPSTLPLLALFLYLQDRSIWDVVFLEWWAELTVADWVVFHLFSLYAFFCFYLIFCNI